MKHHEMLHLSIDGKAACDGRPLDKSRDSDSPECRGMAACSTCHQLMLHFQREARRLRGSKR